MDKSIAKQYKEPKAMAQAKISWLILQMIGWPLTVISFLGNFEEPYKTVVTILSILFLATVVIRAIVRLFDAWETYREKKIANDERKYQINKRHGNQNSA